jgi:hypothetical protein
VVFSGAVGELANRELAELARVLAAPRFVAAPLGPFGAAAQAAAGPEARNVDELALALAAGFYEGVVLLDGHSEFHPLTLSTLSDVASVCLGAEPSPTAEACAIALPVDGDEGPMGRTGVLARLRAHVEGSVAQSIPPEAR